MKRRAAVLAVDGGASKTDVVLLDRDGRVLSRVRAGGASFHPAAHEQSMRNLTGAVRDAAERAGIDSGRGPVANQAAFCLAGADLPSDDRRMLKALTAAGLANHLVLRNDTFAVLRAGTERGWGVGVVCGTGMNCAAVAPDGRTVRFPALGPISGDWGGGGDLGVAAIAAGVRARDGRGPRTVLEHEVPRHFGMRHPYQVMEAVYTRSVPDRKVVALAPLVLRAADQGDVAAIEIVARQADELVALVRTAVRRLRLVTREVDVVMGGGIARSSSPLFHRLVEQGVTEAVPRARIVILREPPVVGAALLGLDLAGVRDGAARRARAALTANHQT